MREKPPVLFAIVAPFQRFFRLEAAGGVCMITGAALALAWANSPLRSLYEVIFHATIELRVAGEGLHWSIHHFTNDGLMTLFFVVAGCEIKRELAHGELSTWRKASLPLLAALGGMVAPALLYLAVNPQGPARAGWGIPVATDIAFALGCLSLVRRRVPSSVFVFLTALAIFDDLGAILVIAVFYGRAIEPTALLIAIAASALLVAMGRVGVQTLWPYALVGFILWLVVLQSGIHASVAGVVIGLAMPTTVRRPPLEIVEELDVAMTSLRRECEIRGVPPDGTVAAIERHLESVQSPLERAVHALHGLVAFGIVPLFALANAGVSIGGDLGLGTPVAFGCLLGLVLGKPLGVLAATVLMTRLGVARRPADATWAHLVGAAMMAGVGFTMSLFIGSLALEATRGLEDQAKLGVLAGSVVSALLAMLLLRFTSRPMLADRPEGVPVVLDVPRFARGYGVRPSQVAAALVGKSIAELDVRRRFGVTIIGVWHGAKATARRLEPVDPVRPLEEGDILLVAGEDRQVDTFVLFAQREGEVSITV